MIHHITYSLQVKRIWADSERIIFIIRYVNGIGFHIKYDGEDITLRFWTFREVGWLIVKLGPANKSYSIVSILPSCGKHNTWKSVDTKKFIV